MPNLTAQQHFTGVTDALAEFLNLRVKADAAFALSHNDKATADQYSQAARYARTAASLAIDAAYACRPRNLPDEVPMPKQPATALDHYAGAHAAMSQFLAQAAHAAALREIGNKTKDTAHTARCRSPVCPGRPVSPNCRLTGDRRRLCRRGGRPGNPKPSLYSRYNADSPT